MSWKPVHILAGVSTSIGSVLAPAGLQNAKGIVSVRYQKDPNDLTWNDDPAMKKWRAFMDKYYPEGDKNDGNNVYAYAAAQLMVKVLEMCGDELTRENVMKQATNLKDVVLDLLLPAISINTTPTDYRIFKQVQMARFDGERSAASHTASIAGGDVAVPRVRPNRTQSAHGNSCTGAQPLSAIYALRTRERATPVSPGAISSANSVSRDILQWRVRRLQGPAVRRAAALRPDCRIPRPTRSPPATADMPGRRRHIPPVRMPVPIIKLRRMRWQAVKIPASRDPCSFDFFDSQSACRDDQAERPFFNNTAHEWPGLTTATKN